MIPVFVEYKQSWVSVSEMCESVGISMFHREGINLCNFSPFTAYVCGNT